MEELRRAVLLLPVFIDKDKSCAGDQGLCGFPAGGTDQTLHCASGNAHFFSGLLLKQSFQIAEPQSLQLITVQRNLFQLPQGHAVGLEGLPGEKAAFTAAVFAGTR